MNFLENCSIFSGIATSDKNIFVTLMNDGLAEERQQHSIPLFFKNDEWSLIDNEKVLPWIVAGIGHVGQANSEVVVVGWGGQVLFVQGDASRREAMQRKDTGSVSIVRSVATIDNTIYTAGMNREVYKRTLDNGWKEIHQDVKYLGNKNDVGFNAIGGFSAEEIYAAGLNGEIWHYDKYHWHEIQSPTNAHLHSLCCASDGYVYIGGKSGVLIRGRHNIWETMDFGFEGTIWDLHCFKDNLYLLDSQGIYLFNDGKFEKIKKDILNDTDFVSFSSYEDRLWVFGSKKIVKFDGQEWQEFEIILSEEMCKPVIGFFNDGVLLSGVDFLEEL